MRSAVACSVAAVLVASCSGHHDAASVHRTPTPHTASVCDGVSDCHLVLSADIDGDGKSDEVAVVGHPDVDSSHGFVSWPPGSTPTIRVLTRSGVVTYRVTFTGPIEGQLIHGVYNIDGGPGQDLLIEDYDGAHGQSETVVRFLSGRLVALPSPDPYDGGTNPVGSWGADGSIMSNLGWHCLPGGRVEEFSAGSNYPKPGYTISHRTWRWTGRGWTATGPIVTNDHASPTAMHGNEYSDWTNCGTFRRFS